MQIYELRFRKGDRTVVNAGPNVPLVPSVGDYVTIFSGSLFCTEGYVVSREYEYHGDKMLVILKLADRKA
jgi:hypothetical protein